jgi:hypothetical protein
MPRSKPKLRRNPIASDLRTAKYAPRIINSERIYNRKRAKQAHK